MFTLFQDGNKPEESPQTAASAAPFTIFSDGADAKATKEPFTIFTDSLEPTNQGPKSSQPFTIFSENSDAVQAPVRCVVIKLTLSWFCGV